MLLSEVMFVAGFKQGIRHGRAERERLSVCQDPKMLHEKTRGVSRLGANSVFPDGRGFNTGYHEGRILGFAGLE